MAKRAILKTWLVISIFLIVLGGPATVAGKTIYVDDDGPADFNNIQAAIDASADGDTVLVAPGTYTGEGNRDIDFKGKSITVKSEYGPESCIIQCGGRYAAGDRSDPIEPEYHRGFHFHTHEDVNSVVQGFTVTQGYMGPHRGGAFLCIESSPTIRDCIIVGNSAMAGGGICAYQSDILVENCMITRNIASDRPWGWFYGTTISYRGGGISISDGNALLLNCFVVGNAATKKGGGIWCSHGNYQIINCTVSGNRTGEWGYGGGISVGPGGSYISFLHNSIVWRNYAGKYGDNIELGYMGILTVMRVNVLNSLIGEDPNSVYDPSSKISGEWLRTDPMFARNGHWDPNGSEAPRSNNKPIWIDGDYHLKSMAGRWDPDSENWVQDDVTSPCIDAGDPNSPIGNEPFPNGVIINMGAYGGTAEASKSPSGVHAKYGGGSGIPNDPYRIATVEDLLSIGDDPNLLDKHYILVADIDLDPNLPGGRIFTKALIAPNPVYPFRETITTFTGCFDGNGYTIRNLLIDNSEKDDYLGIFGFIGSNGQVKNLRIENILIKGQRHNVGGLTGENWGTIIDCHITGSVYGRSDIGGLAGTNGSYELIRSGADAQYNVNDISNETVEGIILACSTDVNVVGIDGGSGSQSVGGLVGSNSGGIISCCSSSGTVRGERNVGGLVGTNLKGKIDNSYSESHVQGLADIGGLVGSNFDSVLFCYSVGTVIGEERFGGLVGRNGGGEVRDSFWDIETSGQTTSDGGVGRTTAGMQDPDTFIDAGWDFVAESVNGTEDIWSICEGTNYPWLTWQIPAGDFVCPYGITIEDFVFFIEHWRDENCDLSNDYCQGTDLDFSGMVNADDLEILLDNWLAESELEN